MSSTADNPPKPANENVGPEEVFKKNVAFFVYSEPFQKFLKRIHKGEDVDELTQELCVVAIANYASFPTGGSLGSWLESLARNVKLADALEKFDLEGRTSASPETTYILRESLNIAIKDFIPSLPTVQRFALILSAFHDCNPRKIARVLSRIEGRILDEATVLTLLEDARGFMTARRSEEEKT